MKLIILTNKSLNFGNFLGILILLSQTFYLIYLTYRKSSPIRILNASNEVAKTKPEETSDGLHYSPKIEKVVSMKYLLYFCRVKLPCVLPKKIRYKFIEFLIVKKLLNVSFSSQ